VREVATALGITSPNQLVLPLVVAFVVAALVSGILRLLLLWVSTRLSYAIGADLSLDAYRRTLYQPYKIHVTRNTSDIITSITGKTWNAMQVLESLLIVTSSSLLLVILMMGLLAIEPYVILIVSIVFGLSYGAIAWVSRRKLKINSLTIAHDSVQVVKALMEGLGGIRDVLLNGTQQVYCDIFRKADFSQRAAKAGNVVIAVSPRFLMEVIGILLIAVLAYGLSNKDGGLGSALPTLGALALGAQRIIPALQQIYFNWAIIAGLQKSLADAMVLLDQPLPPKVSHQSVLAVDFDESIRFESVRFRYLSDGPWVLDGLSLTIPKGLRVGFVGVTGSGKTTTADLLMGLLDPVDGKILVDNQPICGERLLSWQRTIAHVPQSIFLADITIAENIAFGVPINEIDMERVREAASQAQIADFIENRRNGYHEVVGERGIRLSGGQRQRIGIARALYKKASVLVFDEATSSLDNATEQAVMESIENLDRELTIVIIAHRLTTVQNCDIIFELTSGKVAAKGTYEQLLEQSPSFKNMALAVA
jgi:ATP-binding cassette subfamily B protein